MTATTEQSDDAWDEPVYVQVDMRSPQIIHNAAEALAFIANDWPASERPETFAREICVAAVLGQVSAETARTAFAEAVADAKISICAPNDSVSTS